jgi:hypothetical protein
MLPSDQVEDGGLRRQKTFACPVFNQLQGANGVQGDLLAPG